MSLGARVGIAFFGLLVVLTVAAVIAVSTEDPKPSTPTNPGPTSSARTMPPVDEPPLEPAPTVTSIAIGDGLDPPPSTPAPPPVVTHVVPVTPSPPANTPPPFTSAPVTKPKASKPAASGPPRSLGGAPPPNPYAH